MHKITDIGPKETDVQYFSSDSSNYETSNKGRAITQTRDDQDPWRNMTSLGHNEIIINQIQLLILDEPLNWQTSNECAIHRPGNEPFAHVITNRLYNEQCINISLCVIHEIL